MNSRYPTRLAIACLLFAFLIPPLASLARKSDPPEDESFYKRWIQVDAFLAEGLPRSALEITEAIYGDAVRDKNLPQLVKALLYRIRIISQTEEDGTEKAIGMLQNEIKTAAFPVRNICHSLLAERYREYYENHRYEWLSRTPAQTHPDDIATWDLRKLSERILYHHLEAISQANLLQSVPLETYSAILEPNSNAGDLRPTLYDFLVHRAIDRLMSPETYLSMPETTFLFDNPAYLSSYQEFIKIPMETPDSLSMPFFALKLLAELLAFHATDANPAALIDADLKRLDYVHRNAVFDSKDSLLVESLEALRTQFRNHPAVTEVTHRLAVFYNEKGQSYRPFEREEHRWKLRQARQLCDEAMKSHPDSRGAMLCKQLAKQLDDKSLTLKTAQVNLPGSAFPGLLQYRNLANIHYRILQTDPAEDKKTRQESPDRIIEHYLAIKPLTSASFTLPDDGDLQLHRIQLPFPALPAGYYVILLSDGAAFNRDSNLFAYASFWMSNISYVEKRDRHEGTEIFVLDRSSGHPLQHAGIEVWSSEYDYKSRSRTDRLVKSMKTDREGYLLISDPSLRNNQSSYLVFQYGSERLYSESYYNFYMQVRQEPKPEITTFFFTDRAIYRPGQLIQFKGIMLERNGKAYRPVTQQNTMVSFFDANGKKLSELQLVTNEYGSFSGIFTAPKDVLNGRMRLSNENGHLGIQVEEYKRPRFEVNIDPPAQSYVLGETLTVSGQAMSYAGSPLTAASLEYRVIRKARFPYWFNLRGIRPMSRTREIAHGTALTGSDGKWSFQFKALDDDALDKQQKVVYDFEVNVTVTDINGETRNATRIIPLGRVSLLLSLDLPTEINRALPSKFPIFARNLSGEKVPATVKVSAIRLEPPPALLKPREWERPDRHMMKEQEFKKLFPNDVYDNEDDPVTWTKGKTVFSCELQSPRDTFLIPGSISQWPAGTYLFELKATDASGQSVELKKHCSVFSDGKSGLPGLHYLWSSIPEGKAEPDTTLTLLLGSSVKNARIMAEVIRDDKVISRTWVQPKGQIKRIPLKISEQDRGNLGIQFLMVRDNRVFRHNKLINIPYSNKELNISFETFRDQLLPGENEQWKITLSGSKAEKLSGELLLGMYDASLDAFMPHRWDMSLYRGMQHFRSWNPGNFSMRFTIPWESPEHIRPEAPLPPRQYDRLLFDRTGSGYLMSRTKMAGGDAGDMMLMAAKGTQDAAMTERGEETAADETVPEQQALAIPGKELDITQLRTDFRETAFFFPQLQTTEGEIAVSFTAPQSLTRWKVMALAHTADLKTGTLVKELLTRKSLMLFPNLPRFFRHGDSIMLTTKISSLAGQRLQGHVSLECFDALTSEPLAGVVVSDAVLPFSAEAGSNTEVSWQLIIPEGISAMNCRFKARAGDFSDGEETVVPVLPNRMLVTESLPLPVKGKGSFPFHFDKLLARQKHPSTTLEHKALVVEFTGNPVWYAVLAIPYLLESTNESADQLFNRYYANTLASWLVNSDPRIREVIDSWALLSPRAFQSALEKNNSLKSVLLEESPWVRDAADETAAKQRVAALLNRDNLSVETASLLSRLRRLQSPSGAWPWFPGLRDDPYITRQIVAGLGHLKQLGVPWNESGEGMSGMLQAALQYLDQQTAEDYQRIVKEMPGSLAENHLHPGIVHYLYARSFFAKEFPIAAAYLEAVDYYHGQAVKYWLSQNHYLQGMLALALHRKGDKTAAVRIVRSLREKAQHHPELGMYWKELQGGYRWYQGGPGAQALLMEAFDEILSDSASVNDMQTWLLKHKQTNHWKTSTATADACYALLLRGTARLTEDPSVRITLGKTVLDPSADPELRQEAGSGYFSKRFEPPDITPEMGNITVVRKGEGVAWGSVYWQYMENYDKISSAGSPFKISRQLFVRKNTSSGMMLEAADRTTIRPGDELVVRIILECDRDLEYVHLKDLRASGLEPRDVISSYRYQEGIAYYQSTRDAATHFFFPSLPKGKRVFEYSLFATLRGDYSHGTGLVECMYAPEFMAHTEGLRLKIE
ncbi:MAG TPA: alpha-2-macroglobulin family protein [Bacteroidales bacterium]|nr:alpha-2-macroglobulin family protein [Bacteroidales bacterium]HSA44512.1 alpha-2-macroglobulin family protein [Bacteroidales bacterium]